MWNGTDLCDLKIYNQYPFDTYYSLTFDTYYSLTYFCAFIYFIYSFYFSTFGILKGRFRILKSGIRVHGTEACDSIFLTCCALHNMLLDHDGLNKTWTDGVSQSDYLGESGDFEEDDFIVHNEFALYRLHKLIGGTSHTKMDLSKNRRGADCT